MFMWRGSLSDEAVYLQTYPNSEKKSCKSTDKKILAYQLPPLSCWLSSTQSSLVCVFGLSSLFWLQGYKTFYAQLNWAWKDLGQSPIQSAQILSACR